MVGLWADGWFYLSAAGFLISSVLFVFLLGQYRSAVEAEDGGEEEGRPHTLRPDFDGPQVERITSPAAPVAKKPEKTLIVSAEPAAVPVAKRPEPEAKPLLAALPRSETIPPTEQKKWSESTSPGGVSPAIGYLQHIKEHMDRMEKVVDHVNAMADRQAESNQAILAQLGVIAELLRSQASAPAASAPPHEPVREPAHEPVHEPVHEPAPARAPEPEPTPERAPEPAPQEPAAEAPPAAASTLDIQLNSPSGTGEPQAHGSEPPKPARKGPVWPI